MAEGNSTNVGSSLAARLGSGIRRYLPLLLAACYVIALIEPGWGQQLRDWSLPDHWPDVLRPGLSHLLVALLLFLASLGVDVNRLPLVTRKPALVLAALAASWLGPAAVVLLAWWLLPLITDSTVASTLLIGFALVAAMPVANSAAAWTQQSRGELSWTLALVVLSIVVCPWMIPLVLKLLGLSFSDVEAKALDSLTTSFTGLEFVIWVLAPTGLGMLMRWLVGPERVSKHRPAVLVISASTLLLLNYINAAVALPQMKDDFKFLWLVATVAAALAMCLVGFLLARLLGRWFKCNSPTVTALDYSLTMKNTGLALALASNVLAEQWLVLLPVFTVTLVQHLFVGALHRGATRRNESKLPKP